MGWFKITPLKLIFTTMQSYQLFITLSKALGIQIGRLGLFAFPKGKYVYSGSAKKNMEKRIARHLKKKKSLHWHIDYLLANDGAKVVKVVKSKLVECDLNVAARGKAVVRGFGSSDCKEGCKSHLKFLG